MKAQTLIAEGIIEYIHDTVHPSEKFSKRICILDTSVEFQGKVFTSYLEFQATNKDCSKLDNFKVGQKVRVKCDVSNFKIDTDKKSGLATVYNNVSMTSIELANDDQNTNINNAGGGDNFDLPDPTKKPF